MDDLLRWLDIHNSEVRVAGIVGPPGIGKSSLAVHVGHGMIDRGAVVSYVDASLVLLEDLPSKLLHNAGISERGNSSERLLRWLKRDLKHSLIVIFDNCDMLLSSDRTRFDRFLDEIFANAATTVKVLITSRQRIEQAGNSEHFKEYPVSEIDSDASCHLLCSVSKRELNATICRSIIALAGNTPLALELVGTILSVKTTDTFKVISSLRREVGPAFNLKSLSPEKRVNSSISVSLKYLNYKLINLGRYLSLFPGSFSVKDACSVLSGILDEDCVWVEMLRQRALLLHCGGNRYQFRDIVRAFFVNVQDRKEVNHTAFWGEFQKHYSALLHKASLQFEQSPITAMQLFEDEQHNIRHLLKHAHDFCEGDPNVYLEVLQALKQSFDRGLITSFYKESELVDILQNSLACLEHEMEKMTSFEGNIHSETGTNVVHLYVCFTLLIIDLRPAETRPAFLRAQAWVDRLIEHASSSDVEVFYARLAAHYSSLGQLQAELMCHEKILKKANVLKNCEHSTCSPSEIAEAYYGLGRYELSVYVQRLQLNHYNVSTLQLGEALHRLYTCQVVAGNHTDANDTALELLHLSSELVAESVCEIYSHLTLYSSITSLFHLHNWTEEASSVEQILIASVKEAGSMDCKLAEEAGKKISELVHSLFKAQQYASVPEMVQCTLAVYKKGSDDSALYTSEIATLHLLLGKAEFINRNRNSSLASLRVLMDFYYHDPTHIQYTRDACKIMLVQAHIEMVCFLIAWEETMILVHSIAVFIVSDTFVVDRFTSTHADIDSDFTISFLDFLPVQLQDTPLVSFYIFFLVEWCTSNVLSFVRFFFSLRFVFYTINALFIPVKLVTVFSTLIFPFYFTYKCLYSIKYTFRCFRDLYTGVF